MARVVSAPPPLPSTAPAHTAHAVPAGLPVCDDSWTNHAGGPWETGANWSLDKPPTSSQQACITIALSAPVVLNGSTAIAGLTLGGSGGTAELHFHGSCTLTIGGNSTILNTGRLTNDSGIIKIVQTGALTNDGVIHPASSGLEIIGNLTNAADGLILMTPGSNFFFDGPGTFLNKGDLSVPLGANFVAPHASGTSGTLVNAGAIQNQTVPGNGEFTLGAGTTFRETTGTTVGEAPLIEGGSLDLAGPGRSTFYLNAASVSGNVSAGQTLLVIGAITATGSFTNSGLITNFAGSAKMVLPTGATLTNKGQIVVPPGNGLYMTGNLVNARRGRIDISHGNGYAGNLDMNGAYTLTNRGSIVVGSGATLNTSGPNSSVGTVDNATGTIQNDGSVNVATSGTFVEGNGGTTGNPVQVSGGNLQLKGDGASQFVIQQENTSGLTSGNVAPDQVLRLGGGMNAAAGFTNYGTLSGGHVFLPTGDTLTNDGTINVDQGELLIRGNLDNAADGVIGYQGVVGLLAANTKFTNEGTVYLLFSGGGITLGNCDCGPDHTQFINTGTIYYGVDASGTSWGGFGLHASIGPGGPSETIDLGGRSVPVAVGEPPPPPQGPATIVYGMTGSPGNPPTWTLSCPGSAADGWTLDCTGEAVLHDHSDTSLIPTQISLAGSGTVQGGAWRSTYGQPVTFTATISAQSGPAPTGTITFFGYSAPYAPPNPLVVPREVLGTAPLVTSGGVTTAKLTLHNLPPNQYQVQAFYPGNATDLPSNSSYGAYMPEDVNQSSTTTTLITSPASVASGKPVTLTAAVAAKVQGADVTGTVIFTLGNPGNLTLGAAPVKVSKGKATAGITVSSLPVGTNSITASYGGDYNYPFSDSTAKTVTVMAAASPSEVKVNGPRQVKAGGVYSAKIKSNGTGAMFFAIAGQPAAPKKLAADSETGLVRFKIPAKGMKRFSYIAVASNAAGRAESSLVTVKVK
jgi:hypothetical protein